jgi:hypothetical protein
MPVLSPRLTGVSLTATYAALIASLFIDASYSRTSQPSLFFSCIYGAVAVLFPAVGVVMLKISSLSSLPFLPGPRFLFAHLGRWTVAALAFTCALLADAALSSIGARSSAVVFVRRLVSIVYIPVTMGTVFTLAVHAAADTARS